MKWLLVIALSSVFDSPHTSANQQLLLPALPSQGEEFALPSKYIACGCGCCDDYNSEDDNLPRKCVHDQTELQAIIAKDRKTANSDPCDYMGCSMGIVYEVCDFR